MFPGSLSGRCSQLLALTLAEIAMIVLCELADIVQPSFADLLFLLFPNLCQYAFCFISFVLWQPIITAKEVHVLPHTGEKPDQWPGGRFVS